MTNSKRRVVVVGGGPAGMMAAIRASQFVENVILVEKNDCVGKKLLLSGNGRCNLSNVDGLESFLKGYSRHGDFLRDVFKVFFTDELIGFFASRGLRLVAESDGRLFPEVASASCVCDILEKELGDRNVEIMYNTCLTDVVVQDKKVKVVCFSDGSSLGVDGLILATGGFTYRFTGSDGEGMRIVERLGHCIVSLRPGLVPLITDRKFPAVLEGLSLRQVRVVFRGRKKRIISEVGDLVFTGKGISGPCILSISGQVGDLLDKDGGVVGLIDLVPFMNEKEVEERLMKDLKNNFRKSISVVLKQRFPSRLVDVAMDALALDPMVQVSQLKAGDRKRIVSLVKGMKVNIVGVDSLDRAMITRGGISLKEIDPRTMSSRLIDGLFFAGEMIDLDGDTGGYNLQEAFSTGYVAGESAGKYVC